MMDDSRSAFVIDDAYEFSAPQFFDFINGESEEEMRVAELWFDTALSCEPSPFMPRIKTGRSVQLDILCDFSEAEQLTPTSMEANASNITNEIAFAQKKDQIRPQSEVKPVEMIEVVPIEAKEDASASLVNLVPADEKICEEAKHVVSTIASGRSITTQETSTPSSRLVSGKGTLLHTDPKKKQTAKKIASVFRNQLQLNSQNRPQLLQVKSTKPASLRREKNVKDSGATLNFAQENQAIKKQKLEGGKSKQILNIKPQLLPHKLRPGVISSSSNLCPPAAKTRKEDRKVYAREPSRPFVSMAEMMKKFQSNTREMSLSHDTAAIVTQKKTKLTLTRPKEPEFETAQRVRSVRVKSTAQLEEEMMANIPKFKARPLNKKILEAASLPALPRTMLHQPEFQEFHLETMERAMNNAETSTIASTESSPRDRPWRPHHRTTPKLPLLQTSLRARPPRIKTTAELEKEMLENVPKFKARPLNKKIFESKGDLGMFCNTKRHHTIPQEFHFATDERIPPPENVADMFDKLSLCSESRQDRRLPRITTPNPFHLHTEERGAVKERKLVTEVVHTMIEEERARIPKAAPYPYTTDYPVIPPKPEAKRCTKPEPFQLESLLKHDEEMQREMEERQRLEEEEAQMRIFKAQPILKEDPIPVPEKVRKPLTEVQVFNLHIEQRAVDRAEFDKKIKEKKMIYKRYREEAESANMIEEEKALKQLRRTMVIHAKPVPDFAHPFLPQKSFRDVTKPKSPALRANRRKEGQKLVSAVAAASSSAASNMR